MTGRFAAAAAAILALLLAGCTPPDIRPASTARTAPALGLAGPPTPAIDAAWWRAFGDPQLDRIVGDALAGSPTLEQALARARQAQAQLAQQRAELRPDITADVNPQVQRLPEGYIIPPPYGGSVRFVGTALANLSWNIDLFGRQRAAIAQAGAAADAARLDIAAARLMLAGSVVQSYLELARSEAQVAIARDTIAARQGSLKLVQAQVRARLASKLQTEAATTLLAQAGQTLAAAEGNRRLAADALAALAGRGPDYAAGLGPSALKLDALPPLPATVPADLLARRPDIAAAQARVASAAAGRQVARRAYYPNLNLVAQVGLQALGLGNFFDLGATTAGIGPALHLPLFEGGRLRAGLESATADLDLATAAYNERVVNAAREAIDAIVQVNSLAAQRGQSRAVVRGFTETQRLNGIRINSGLESRLDTVETDIRLLEARLIDTNLTAALAQQRVALIVALGGGFDAQQDSTP